MGLDNGTEWGLVNEWNGIGVGKWNGSVGDGMEWGLDNGTE